VYRYDYVEVYDGNNAEGKLLGRYCGNEVRQLIHIITLIHLYFFNVVPSMNIKITDAALYCSIYGVHHEHRYVGLRSLWL